MFSSQFAGTAVLFLVLISAPSASQADSSACPGNLSGRWVYVSDLKGSCNCPAIPSGQLLNFESFTMNVCHNGNSLSGSVTLSRPAFHIDLTGTVNGSHVNFTAQRKGTGTKCAGTFRQTDINQGTAGGTNFISGRVQSSATVSCPGKCSCSASGNFQLNIGGGGQNVTNVSKKSGITKQNVETSGVQWLDFNKDRKLDLLLIGRNGNALFRNKGRGKFANVTSSAHLTNNNRDARGATSADLDNDGDVDIVIANATGPLTILKNNGRGTYSDASSGVSSPVLSPAAGEVQGVILLDYDKDGSLDMYIIRDGGPNQLMKHSGLLQFTDVTNQAHLAFTGPSRSAVSADFNNDGFPDIYLALSHQRNKLYINNGDGAFQEIGKKGHADFNGDSLQVIAADFDHDGKDPEPGDIDLFVVNNAGSSALLRNNFNKGSLTFTNITGRAKLKSLKKGRAAAFIDFDNDADEDLVIVQSQGGNFLFTNNGKTKAPKFTKTAVDLSNPSNPTGMTIGDFDNDGSSDIMIGDGGSQQDNGDTLLQNQEGVNNFIALTLEGTSSNRSAIGAQVFVFTGVLPQTKTVSSGNGQNQESLTLLFGLGTEASVRRIIINWPGGTGTQICDGPFIVNQRYKITETPPCTIVRQ